MLLLATVSVLLQFSFVNRGLTLGKKLPKQPFWILLTVILIVALLITAILLSILLPLIISRRHKMQTRQSKFQTAV